MNTAVIETRITAPSLKRRTISRGIIAAVVSEKIPTVRGQTKPLLRQTRSVAFVNVIAADPKE